MYGSCKQMFILLLRVRVTSQMLKIAKKTKLLVPAVISLCVDSLDLSVENRSLFPHLKYYDF